LQLPVHGDFNVDNLMSLISSQSRSLCNLRMYESLSVCFFVLFCFLLAYISIKTQSLKQALFFFFFKRSDPEIYESCTLRLSEASLKGNSLTLHQSFKAQTDLQVRCLSVYGLFYWIDPSQRG